MMPSQTYDVPNRQEICWLLNTARDLGKLKSWQILELLLFRVFIRTQNENIFWNFFEKLKLGQIFDINYYLATLSNNLSKQSWVLLDLILSKNGQFMKNSNHRKLSTDYRQNLRSYQNLTVIQMALKKLHLAPWIRWYPWTERASADLSLWAANDIHFQTTIINDEIVHDYDENWLSIYGSSSTMGWNIF